MYGKSSAGKRNDTEKAQEGKNKGMRNVSKEGRAGKTGNPDGEICLNALFVCFLCTLITQL